MEWQDQKRDARPVRRVRLSVETEFAEEDRLAVLADRQCLGNAQIVPVGKLLGLEVDVEPGRHAKRGARRGQCVERKEEEREAEPADSARRPWSPHAGGVAVFRAGLKNGVFTTFADTRCRTASTVISNCTTVPSPYCG